MVFNTLTKLIYSFLYETIKTHALAFFMFFILSIAGVVYTRDEDKVVSSFFWAPLPIQAPEVTSISNKTDYPFNLQGCANHD